MSKERPTWLRTNIELFPKKQLEKGPLVDKDAVENCCELENIKKLPKMDEFKIGS
jgi:hypothetical protein